MRGDRTLDLSTEPASLPPGRTPGKPSGGPLILVLLAVLVAFLVFGALVLGASRSAPDPETPVSRVSAVNEDTGSGLGDRIVLADTAPARRKVLLGRDGLDAGEGIYLTPCFWVHMFWMRFPIDAAYLDGDGRVLAMSRGLKPWRIGPLVWRADGVLELPEGTLARTGAEKGHRIVFSGGSTPKA